MLHLHRVMDNSAVNRMNSQNLAIIFGPTLMGTGAGSNIADAGWQTYGYLFVAKNFLYLPCYLQYADWLAGWLADEL
ncbi:hypothetical protein DL764_010927 [Monosporascus ibericus]|uniref:Rho-GAP domain-containing protein n=1 Tax=Monosporascus ibericus TaxID=155417 RepID=A0A4Q4SU75_9PEZI|nr:hypothetical protein DL764_010927 [Monosporascus ibericus]